MGKKYSMKRYLALAILAFIVPIILFFLGSNLYAASSMHSQITASTRNTVRLYAKQLDDKLNAMDDFLINIGTSSMELKKFGGMKERELRILSGLKVKNQFRNELPLYETVADGLFLYQPQDDYYIRETVQVENIERQEQIKEEIISLCREIGQRSRPVSVEWYARKIGESYYLLRIYYFQGVYYGSWSNAERIIECLLTIPVEGAEKVMLLSKEKVTLIQNQEELEEKEIVLDGDLSEDRLTGKWLSYLVQGEEIQGGAFYFVVLFQDKSLRQVIVNFMVITLGLILLSVGLLFLFVKYANCQFVKPMAELCEGMEQVARGNLKCPISEDASVREMAVAQQGFNSMVGEIDHLKIQVYEERLQKQKVQMDFLKLQTNPHFFINTMNVIYNYAILNQIDRIKQMARALSQHFRYTLYGENQVTVREELEFIENYLQLQKMHTIGTQTVEVNVEVEESVLSEEIPILSIQTFVENSMKYGENEEYQVQILIEGKRLEGQGFFLAVSDRGQGFSQEVLQAYQEEKAVYREGKKRIGIDNVKKRLELLYGYRACMKLKNADGGGARVELYFKERDHEEQTQGVKG